jgi:hypothetical protein
MSQPSRIEYSAIVGAHRPSAVCTACWRVWVADRLRSHLLHCWHRRVAARLRGNGRWAVLEGVTTCELDRLRAEMEGR